MPPESRDDLLASIEEEGDRLARFVANLLDMTRIEAGTVDAKRDWVDVPTSSTAPSNAPRDIFRAGPSRRALPTSFR